VLEHGDSLKKRKEVRAEISWDEDVRHGAGEWRDFDALSLLGGVFIRRRVRSRGIDRRHARHGEPENTSRAGRGLPSAAHLIVEAAL
jgi:hypothetical protein